MTVASTDLRVVATQVVGLLTDEGTSLEQRVELAHTLLWGLICVASRPGPRCRRALRRCWRGARVGRANPSQI